VGREPPGRVIGSTLVTSRRTDPSTADLAQLLSELGHELRTPLAVIRIQAQMLKRVLDKQPVSDPILRERYAAGLERIDQAVSTLNAVLERTIETEARSLSRPDATIVDDLRSSPGTHLAK
jgi:signal transduction histidine kinase